MGVLQAGDELGFGFEAADEFRVVGVAGQDDLDGHLALDQRLDGAVDDAETAFADAVAEFVAADGAPGEILQPDLLGRGGGVGRGCGVGVASVKRAPGARKRRVLRGGS